MTRYIYKIIPAPAKGRKAPGVKSPEARFAHALEEAINAWAAQGWEYLRADILPSEERQGLTSTQRVYRSVLVFRRAAAEAAPEPHATPSLSAQRDAGFLSEPPIFRKPQGAPGKPAEPDLPAPPGAEPPHTAPEDGDDTARG